MSQITHEEAKTLARKRLEYYKKHYAPHDVLTVITKLTASNGLVISQNGEDVRAYSDKKINKLLAASQKDLLSYNALKLISAKIIQTTTIYA